MWCPFSTGPKNRLASLLSISLPKLLTQGQCAPIYPDMRLYRNSLAQFDRYLHEQLQHYTKTSFFYHLIALLTLTNLRFNFGYLQRIGIAFLFKPSELDHQKRLEEIDNARLCLNMEKEPDCTGYREMMAAFFSNRTRSSLYCIRRSYYIDLAMLCVNYLTSPPYVFISLSEVNFDLILKSIETGPGVGTMM